LIQPRFKLRDPFFQFFLPLNQKQDHIDQRLVRHPPKRLAIQNFR
jgi:hypothetical protein